MKRLIAVLGVVFALALLAMPAYAVSSVTNATVNYNSVSGDRCGMPQTNVTIDITGTFDANDAANIDGYAVKLIDARSASLWPPVGTASNVRPQEAGRADFRFFEAQTGSTAATITANVYHPSLNPVRLEVYEVVNYVPNAERSTGELGRLLYTRTFEAPCEGAGSPPDDRIADPLTGPVVVYARDNRQVSVEIWRVLEGGRGELALTVSASQLAATPENPNRAVRIAGTPDGIELYRLTTGQCQVNAPRRDGSLYTLQFECPETDQVLADSSDPMNAQAGGDNVPEVDETLRIPGAPVLVNLPANNRRTAIEVYRLNSANEGILTLRVTFAQLNSVPETPAENTRIVGTRDDSIVVYRLTTGECQVNAERADSTDPYVFIFECPTQP
ncbi:MAG: hypothetical protein OHK0046_09060 [Anaerolineae bacterium]